MTISRNLLPPRRDVEKLLLHHDFFLWEYYGNGFLGKIQAWIFKKRLFIIYDELKNNLDVQNVLDVGCGSGFSAFVMLRLSFSNYIGIDLMPSDKLNRYKQLIISLTGKQVELIRASAESLPFRSGVFDQILALDLLEHLNKPKNAINEIKLISKGGSSFTVSLPLENWLQRFLRIGFLFMGERARKIIEGPDYHYIGDIKSYNEMAAFLSDDWELLKQRFSPLGLTSSVNINGILFYKKSE